MLSLKKKTNHHPLYRLINQKIEKPCQSPHIRIKWGRDGQARDQIFVQVTVIIWMQGNGIIKHWTLQYIHS